MVRSPPRRRGHHAERLEPSLPRPARCEQRGEPADSTSRITPSERLSGAERERQRHQGDAPEARCAPRTGTPPAAQRRRGSRTASRARSPSRSTTAPERWPPARRRPDPRSLPARRRPSSPTSTTVPTPRIAVASRCWVGVSMPSVDGMARNTVYSGGWSAVGRSMSWYRRRNGLSNQWPSKKPRACQW